MSSKVNLPVLFPSIVLIATFVVLTLTNLDSAASVFGSMREAVARGGGWFLVLTVNVLLMFCAWAAFSRFGRVRLGGDGARPDFSTWEWFAMLFSAGMGIGLLFYGVAEPITHYAHPPGATQPENPIGIAREAMGFTYLHWGLHAWGIYAVIGLGLAYVSFNRNRPLTVSSALDEILPANMPLLGHAVDVLAIVATVCGVATSLGLGAAQVNAGLAFLFNVPQSTSVQLLLIGGITGLATVSVALGLRAGIKRLSEMNMLLAAGLMLFVLLAGPTLFVLNGLVQNVGYYVEEFVRLATWTETYTGTHWQDGWTVFYYAWWISWSPFVGMFIARISYGRTIREFVLGVLLVPTLLTFVWMAVFGNSALHIEMFGGGGLAAVVDRSAADAMFEFLAHLPWVGVSAALTTIVIVTFFVTSADSGALVTDIMASGGHLEPPLGRRVAWAVSLGVMAAVLLVGGGLAALQTAAIVTGTPFALVLLLICVGLRRMLIEDSWVLDVPEEPRVYGG